MRRCLYIKDETWNKLKELSKKYKLSYAKMLEIMIIVVYNTDKLW